MNMINLRGSVRMNGRDCGYVGSTGPREQKPEAPVDAGSRPPVPPMSRGAGDQAQQEQQGVQQQQEMLTEARPPAMASRSSSVSVSRSTCGISGTDST